MFLAAPRAGIGRGTQLVTDFGSRNAFPSVRQCVDADSSHDITITAADGRGQYHYQIFSRADEAG